MSYSSLFPFSFVLPTSLHLIFRFLQWFHQESLIVSAFGSLLALEWFRINSKLESIQLRVSLTLKSIQLQMQSLMQSPMFISNA